MSCNYQSFCCSNRNQCGCLCNNSTYSRRNNAVHTICQGIKDIREGIACLNTGLEEIVNRHFCEGKQDICTGICIIKQALCKIIKCLKFVYCDLDGSELRRVRDGIYAILAGIQVICIGIRAICAGNRDEGIRVIREGIQIATDGLDAMVGGFGSLLCEENGSNNNISYRP